MAAVVTHRFLDLRGEFARRRQDQCARQAARGRRRALEQGEQRQREGRGLAGAGLRAGDDVAALEHDRDGLALDGRGDGVTALEHGAYEVLGQAEGSKFRHGTPMEKDAI